MGIEDLYIPDAKDIRKSGIVFEAAFHNDPVWKAVLKGLTLEQKQVYFESAGRYCRKFGRFLASSPAMEGFIGWVPADCADMTISRGMQVGSPKLFMKVGMKFLMGIKPVFEPLEEARRNQMADRDYLYLMILGVAPEQQGKGYGSLMLRTVLEEADRAGLPTFLETATQPNIRMYEGYGFRVCHQVIHPIINLPQWGMVREPPAAG